jgi:cell division protein FtsB
MKTGILLLLSLFTITGNAQQPESTKIKELEQKLDQVTRQLEQLDEAVQSLRAEIAKLKGEANRDVQSPASASLQPAQAEAARSEFAERIIEPEMGASEREETLRARPIE